MNKKFMLPFLLLICSILSGCGVTTMETDEIKYSYLANKTNCYQAIRIDLAIQQFLNKNGYDLNQTITSSNGRLFKRYSNLYKSTNLPSEIDIIRENNCKLNISYFYINNSLRSNFMDKFNNDLQSELKNQRGLEIKIVKPQYPGIF